MKAIDTSAWQEFRLEDLGFSNFHGERLNKSQRVDGDIPFITAGKINQGIAQYIDTDRELYHKAITVDMFGNCFFQRDDCTGDDNVYFFVNDKLSDEQKIFIACSVNSVTSLLYAYKEQFRQPDADALAVNLPVDSGGNPDWDYMQSVIERQLEKEKKRLNSILKISSIQPRRIDTSTWKEFKLVDIFYMKNTLSITSNSIIPDSGKTPYVTAQQGNNGIQTYIECPPEWLDKGGCILIGGKSLTFSYQEHDFCSNDSHNIALYARDSQAKSLLVQLFLIAILRASFKRLFSWSDSISMRRARELSIHLPVNSEGSPDWKYAERFMNSRIESATNNLAQLYSLAKLKENVY